MPRQCVVIVLDSVGIGALPDAGDFGDLGSDTLGHIDQRVGLAVPNLAQLGLGNITRGHEASPSPPLGTAPGRDAPGGAYGRMIEASRGKDSATGHWELMGLITDTPFKTYPGGFPTSLIDEFVTRCGLPGVLANRAASGTVIIHELGREHLETGMPIVYTSADPVFQVAAHEGIVGVERLHAICQIAYDLCLPYGLNRVIARPFVGEWPHYERTANRRDFTVPPPAPTTLDRLEEAGLQVAGIGKIGQLFTDRGLTTTTKTKGNADGIAKTLQRMRARQDDLVFVNLVDFDSKYGHRRDPEGYAECLAAFDRALPDLLAQLGPDDLLLLTADHGNDPTFSGTDHTREYVPVLAAGEWVRPGSLGTRRSFADLGATVAEFLGHPEASGCGESFLGVLSESPQAQGKR